jgi:hypothetical protein
MTKIASSPDRYTFQVEAALNRAAKNGETVPEEYLEFWKTVKQQDEENMENPDWQKDNMEYDLRSTEWICTKARSSDSYAQNLYAAMCNNEFQKLDVMPILSDKKWSCSWRSAGGIIADMLEVGDYIDWYCSGIRDIYKPIDDEQFSQMSKEEQESYLNFMKYVPESQVTDEIEADLKALGWIVLEN